VTLMLPDPFGLTAALVRGGANGQTEWRDAEGLKLGEIEAKK
jgi:hypothetical protein